MPANRVAERLAQTVGEQRYRMWFERSAKLSVKANAALGPAELLVKVPNRFIADWIGRHFDKHLHEATRAELGDEAACRIEIDPQPFDAARANGQNATPDGDDAVAAQPAALAGASTASSANVTAVKSKAPAKHTPTRAAMRHRLRDFVVGASNELAYAAAIRLVEDQVHASRPLFIHGACGLGKTHLLQGACDAMLERKPHARVLYSTAEQFTNRFLEAIRSGKLDAFRKQIRRLDLLAVDDVHFFANKAATQQEFMHSFDAIDMEGSRVILASDSHPKLIQQFSEALVSRCISGMVVEVHTPDRATRLRLLQNFALRRGMALREGVAEMLADQCFGSIRELEGLITRLDALASLDSGGQHHGPIGRAMVDRLMSHERQHLPRRVVRVDAVMHAVAEQTGVSRQAILSHDRRKAVVLARSLVIHLSRKLTSMSYPEIAAAMSRSNHSSILTAARRIERQIEAGETMLLPDQAQPLPLQELVGRIETRIMRG